MEQAAKLTTFEGTFQAEDGLKIFERRWLPEADAKALLFLVHGFAEHSGRYQHVGEYFASQRYAVFALDHRGHGQSEGKRVLIKSFDQIVQDFKGYQEHIRQQFPQKPVFILGHSMGGTVVTRYVLRYQPTDVRGIILSGPLLRMKEESTPVVVLAASIMGALFPELPLVKLDGTAVSRDPKVVELYDSDPLNYRQGTPAKTAVELLKATRLIQASWQDFRLPVLILSGSDDRLVDVQGSKLLYEHCSSDDKSLKIYEGFYHEILNEPEKMQVMGDILTWMEARL